MKNTNRKARNLLAVAVLLLISLFVFVTVGSYGIGFAEATDDQITATVEIPDLDDDFDDSCILVVMSKKASEINKIYRPSYFGDNIESVEDLTKITGDIEDKHYLNKDEFKQILKLNLIEKGKQSIITTLQLFESKNDFLWIGPSYLKKTEWLENNYDYMSNYVGGLYHNEWALFGKKGINITDAWNITKGSKKVRVGIIDSGIADNAMLKDNLVEGWDFVNNNAITNDDTYGHGTHIAGIIGMVPPTSKDIKGVCPNVQLVPLQVLKDGGAATEAIVKAITWSIDHNIDILNCSYGDKEFSSLEKEAMGNYQGLMVCASGNSSNDNDIVPIYPSDYSRGQEFSSRVISVSAITESGKVLSGSNYGAKSVSIFAPGEMIESTYPTSLSPGGAKFLSGTSMAAPFVTGVAALMFSIYLDMDFGEDLLWTHADIAAMIKEKILNTATYESNLKGKCVSNGRLNAYDAVRSVATYKTTVLSDDTLRIDGIGHDYLGDELIMPQSIGGRLVTEIGEFAFANQTWLKNISISAHVERIGANAFANATALEGVGFFKDYKPGDQTGYNCLKTIGNAAFYNCSSLEIINIPKEVAELGYNAFEKCTKLMSIDFSGNKNIADIKNGTFAGCTNLMVARLSESITNIGANAFQNCNMLTYVYSADNGKLTTIDNSAFENCSALLIFEFSATIQSIGYNAFRGCAKLESIVLANNLSTIGANAFAGCEDLTIYTSISSIPNGWVAGWNSANRPVVLGCTLNSNLPYVTSFTKSASNPMNINAVNGLNNPKISLSSYYFGGWYTTSDFSGTKYDNIASAPNGVLYANWMQSESCVAEGTLITLADGSQVAVEDLKGDEQLLVWNMLTGKFEAAPILFIDSDPERVYEIINLHFSDGTTVKVIDEHAFWDCDLNKYVYLKADAHKFIGHWFNKQITAVDGSLGWDRVQLVDVEISREITTAWSPVTYGYMCYYVNGMLSMPGATQPLTNIFDVDGESMTVNKVAFENDIEMYGLFSYDEFAELFDVPEYVFEAVGGKYLKVALGKGLTTVDELQALVQRYRKFFV